MALNVSTSNYINTQSPQSGSSQNVSGTVTAVSEGVSVSVKGLDLQAGQTLSGQVVEVDGKEIKLLLSNNQTINAKLEGNINALLGQTLSFEVKGTENGQTALRPLYTNLNSSPAVANALSSAGLPQTLNYAKMVSTMMDEGMPVNKNALYDMSKSVNTYPTADPATIVKLNKLGLQVNELTINQYENYKGLERQIIGDVDTLTKGVSDLIKDSLSDTLSNITGESSQADTNSQGILSGGKNLLSAFLNAFSGNEVKNQTELQGNELQNTIQGDENTESLQDENTGNLKLIDNSVFDTAKSVLDMVDTEINENNVSNVVNESVKTMPELESAKQAVLDSVLSNTATSQENVDSISVNSDAATQGINENISDDSNISDKLKGLVMDLVDNLNNDGVSVDKLILAKLNSTSDTQVANEDKTIVASDNQQVTNKDVIALAKDIISKLDDPSEKVSQGAKEKLVKLLSDTDFSKAVKDSLSKQILLKPEESINAKSIDDLYSKIIKQVNQATELLTSVGKETPELMNAAKNISDNISFMNELNQVATYVQLPLLMNNKSAHGDLYVYTNKKSLKDNNGELSALLHLDMDNLGPMDVYVKLSEGKKLNTNFYLKDEATIDFLADHIDYLNKRLTDKGYNIDTNMSVKDRSKKSTNMADEFLKDEPGKEGMTASKFSFDVRA